MGLLDSLGQGLSAAGYGAAELFSKQALLEQQSAFELERQKRLAEFQNELKNAPLKRFGELVKSESGVETEKTVPELKTLTGYDPAAAESGPSQPRFAGDIAATKAAIAKLPEADRIKAEAQLAGQIEADQKLNGLLNSGMRKRTAEESVAAASKRALADDPEAYAAYEERIGKPLRDERKSERADRAAELAMQKADASALAAERRDATQRYIAELRSEDANKRLEALIANHAKGGDPIKETLAFVAEARKDLANEALQLRSMYQAELKDVLDPKEKDSLKRQYEPKFAAIEQRRRALESDFSTLRERVGLPGKESAPAAGMSDERKSQFKVIR